MSGRISLAEVIIANGQSLSSELDLRNHELCGFEMPAAWTAAGISFQSCGRSDGTGPTLQETFLNVVDQAGAAITITAVAAGNFILLSSTLTDQLRGLARTKLRSGTNAVPVNQGQAVTIRCILTERR